MSRLAPALRRAQANHRRETIAISGRFLAIRGDTQKSSWVLVDTTAFAVFAGLSEDVWARLVGGFLDHSLGGAARIESVKLTSSANTSLLTVALAPTKSSGFQGAVARNVLLSEFRTGDITGLLLALPVVRALMNQEGSPRNLTLRKSQPSHEQTQALDRLLTAAKNYLQQLQAEHQERAIGSGPGAQSDRAALPKERTGGSYEKGDVLPGGVDKARGRVKKAVGELTDNQDLKREDEIDKASGKVKEVTQKVADKARGAVRK